MCSSDLGIVATTMVRSSLALIALAACSTQCDGLQTQANPIRKVVTMLRNLKAKVEGEGEKEREIHEKYMCYCKNGAAGLEKSIADAGPKLPQLKSDISAAVAKKSQLDSEIAGHKADQAACKTAMAEATGLRAKAKGVFDAALAEEVAELGPIDDTLAALKKGASASFIQSSTELVQNLKKVVQKRENMNDGDRSELVAFLSESSDSEYAPDGGEIVGILSTMKDEVEKDIAQLKADEEADIKSYDGAMAAKKSELEPIQSMVESKLLRASKIPVSIVEMKNDLGDTGEQIVEDTKFLADLSTNCASKEKFFTENVQMRSQEIEALADTIKVLNDDDALELFKKTLPGASSFLQIAETTGEMRARAVSAISGVKRNVGVDFIVLSLKGKKAGSDKVIKLIDDLTAALQKESQDDADKKEYCAVQFDEADDKKKVFEKDVADHQATIDDLTLVPAQLESEIDALGDGIRELDKTVAEATEQRQEEAAAYAPFMANDATAKELILFAKNRLNKFYNPKQYKAPTESLTDEDRATLAAGGTLAPVEATGIAGTGIGLAQVAPPPPPAAIEAYGKKSEESGGVIALMDLLVKDLDKEMLEAKATETNAQEDYNNLLSDAAGKRTKDAQALSDKEGVLADTKASLLEAKDAKASSQRELMAVEQFISNMHADCDWLIQYFDMRLEARNSEIDAMQKAKAILHGANYS